MKKIITAILFVAISISINAQDVWSLRDSMKSSGRAGSASFVAFGQGWVVSGLNDSGFKRKMYSYNPFQDDWDNEPSIGGLSGDGLERGAAVGFALRDRGYVCLGQGNFVQYSKDLWEYDPFTETWSQKADFAGEARRQAVAFSVGDFAYVGTGQSASGNTKDFYKYDPITNSWTQVADFGGTERRQAVAFGMGGHGYVGTGNDGIDRNDFWQYNVTADSWTQKANYGGLPRSGAVGWAFGNSGFIALGEDNTSAYRKDVWQYYYYSDSWVQRSDFMGSPRKDAIAFVINHVAYVGAGYDGDFKDDFYGYNGILGLDENEIEFSSVCYPNPVKDVASIALGDKNSSDYSIEIYTLLGKKMNPLGQVQKSGNSLQINVSNFSKGNYIYKLVSKNSQSTSTGKIIKL